LEDLTLPETHPEATNGSSANGTAANGVAAAELVGQTVEGSVTGITHFGAFVNLEGGQTGLIHISEIAYEYVRDVRDHLKLNERVKVKVLQVNPANGKYDLSLKQTREAPAAMLPKWRRRRRPRLRGEALQVPQVQRGATAGREKEPGGQARRPLQVTPPGWV